MHGFECEHRTGGLLFDIRSFFLAPIIPPTNSGVNIQKKTAQEQKVMITDSLYSVYNRSFTCEQLHLVFDKALAGEAVFVVFWPWAFV